MWGARSLEYLGHEIGDGLVSVPEARIKALRDFHRPTNQKGLRAFLGTASYYRRFIPEFAKWAGPLFAASKKGAPCFTQWDKCEQMHLTILSMFFVTNAHLHFPGQKTSWCFTQMPPC